MPTATSAERVSDMTAQQATILVVDDHPMFRLGVSQFLQPHASFRVLEAMSQQEANVAFRNHEIDLAIVDISLPDGSGLELIKHQKTQRKSTRWLVLSVHTDTFHQTRARQSGAHGFLGKRAVQSDLLDAVTALLAGCDYPSGWGQAVGGKHSEEAELQMLHMLSERELTVFRLISEGNSVEQIANSLSRSRKTINAIRDRIRAKLGIGSSAELTRFATQWYISQAEMGPPRMKFLDRPEDTQSAEEKSETDDRLDDDNAQSGNDGLNH